jgi:hypothetical protein
MLGKETHGMTPERLRGVILEALNDWMDIDDLILSEDQRLDLSVFIAERIQSERAVPEVSCPWCGAVGGHTMDCGIGHDIAPRDAVPR